jgi:hypothetical protein
MPKDDDWLFSGHKLLLENDGSALASLLRSGGPLPDGVRHMLADLIAPDVNDYLGKKLVLTKVKSEKIMDGRRMFYAVNYFIAYEYFIDLGEKEPSKAAAEAVGEYFGLSSRKVERCASEFRDSSYATAAWIVGSTSVVGKPSIAEMSHKNKAMFRVLGLVIKDEFTKAFADKTGLATKNAPISVANK